MEFLAHIRGWQSEARKQRRDKLLQLNSDIGLRVALTGAAGADIFSIPEIHFAGMRGSWNTRLCGKTAASKIFTYQGSTTCMEVDKSWTIMSSVYNHLRQGRDKSTSELKTFIRAEVELQERLETMGYRSPTWRLLRVLQSLFTQIPLFTFWIHVTARDEDDTWGLVYIRGVYGLLDPGFHFWNWKNGFNLHECSSLLYERAVALWNVATRREQLVSGVLFTVPNYPRGLHPGESQPPRQIQVQPAGAAGPDVMVFVTGLSNEDCQ